VIGTDDGTSATAGAAPTTGVPDDLRQALETQRADLDALTDDVRDLTDAVGNLADRLMGGTPSATGGHGGGNAPWCWQNLDDDAAESMWRDLAEWVGWLRGRYPIAEQLPACWPQHTELVEELTALHAVWNAAYLDAAAHPSGAADFHDRWLPGTLTRIRTWGVHCTNEHRSRADGVYDSRPADIDTFDARPGQS